LISETGNNQIQTGIEGIGKEPPEQLDGSAICDLTFTAQILLVNRMAKYRELLHSELFPRALDPVDYHSSRKRRINRRGSLMIKHTNRSFFRAP
jgi:hypothetical protein